MLSDENLSQVKELTEDLKFYKRKKITSIISTICTGVAFGFSGLSAIVGKAPLELPVLEADLSSPSSRAIMGISALFSIIGASHFVDNHDYFAGMEEWCGEEIDLIMNPPESSKSDPSQLIRGDNIIPIE